MRDRTFLLGLAFIVAIGGSIVFLAVQAWRKVQAGADPHGHHRYYLYGLIIAGALGLWLLFGRRPPEDGGGRS